MRIRTLALPAILALAATPTMAEVTNPVPGVPYVSDLWSLYATTRLQSSCGQTVDAKVYRSKDTSRTGGYKWLTKAWVWMPYGIFDIYSTDNYHWSTYEKITTTCFSN